MALGAAGLSSVLPLDRTYTNLDTSKLMSTSYFNGGIGAAIPR